MEKTFEREILTVNGKLHFLFTGNIEKEDLDFIQLKEDLDEMLSGKNFDFYSLPMNQQLEKVRILFHDFDEKEFFFEKQEKEKDAYFSIDFKNKKLYTYSERISLEREREILTYYREDMGFKLEICEKGRPVTSFECDHLKEEDTSNSVLQSTLIFDKLHLLEELDKTKDKVNLAKDQTVLVQLYQLFFKENPDFSDLKTCEKALAMGSILSNSGWDPFQISKTNSLESIIKSLTAKGKIENIADPITFNPIAEREIVTIGEIVRSYINSFYNPTRAIANIRIMINVKNLDAYHKNYFYDFPFSKEEANEIKQLLDIINGVMHREDEGTIASKYQNLRNSCMKYKEKVLNYRGNSFDVEQKAETIAENGFIEKFCLSEEEKVQLKKIRKEKRRRM